MVGPATSSRAGGLARPKVICHMATSIDGRLLVERWTPPASGIAANLIHRHYEALAARLDADGWLVGRKSMAPYANGRARAFDNALASSPRHASCDPIGGRPRHRSRPQRKAALRPRQHRRRPYRHHLGRDGERQLSRRIARGRRVLSVRRPGRLGPRAGAGDVEARLRPPFAAAGGRRPDQRRLPEGRADRRTEHCRLPRHRRAVGRSRASSTTSARRMSVLPTANRFATSPPKLSMAVMSGCVTALNARRPIRAEAPPAGISSMAGAAGASLSRSCVSDQVSSRVLIARRSSIAR